ncbi:unnamed protein product [Polarella glacialis]|uniref:Dynein assembly factor 1, axonemal homolog n=1 Tax=Polarella glacialis TaxID=89957 RepID=A0A813DZ42_POLGL|nr:unnamed protein product [Polarella glacialis]
MPSRPPGLPTLPLRQDVLLSNSLFADYEDISEEFLQELTGARNLEDVEFVDLQVDAVGAGQRVEVLGELLPNLQSLRLNQSHICTVRDLGTSLAGLRVLWLCRCSLQDLGGINALPVLEELYVSFNDIRDLSPLSSHEALQVLDVEGNSVEDVYEVKELQGVLTLRELNLSMNPVWKAEGVTREVILQALPQLEVLDDMPRDGKVVHDDLIVETDVNDDFGFSENGASGASVTSDSDKAEMDGDDDVSSAADDDDFEGIADLLKEVAEVCPERPADRADESGSSAIRELRRRAAAQVEDSWADGIADQSGSKYCGAVAEFHAGAARALLESAASHPWDAHGEMGPETASPQKTALRLEPSEQDLVVESLKRADRPVSTLWSYRASGRTARGLPEESFRCRPRTGFFPARRDLPTAWCSGSGSIGSASTARPATASSSAGTSRSAAMSSVSCSGAEFDAASSELTAGDDGSVLAGNPLEAIRRRRRVAAARGEDAMDIRDLLRRFEASAEQEETVCIHSEVSPGSCQRPPTADVRVNPGKLMSAVQVHAGSRQLPSRSGGGVESLGSPRKLPQPTKVQGNAEVLVLEG